MHKLNVLILGSDIFKNTLNELKPYLKFNILEIKNDLNKDIIHKDQLVLCDNDYLRDKNNYDIVKKYKCIKILATTNKRENELFNAIIHLPTNLKEINKTIETSVAKKQFIENSSITIKSFSLDKNEKKLSKNGVSLILTEKEIQLLELLINNTQPISKNEILSKVWNYSTDADTHTVETHIYRLRKKISEKFSDEDIIHNNKEGYFIWKKEIKLQLICFQKSIEKELLNLKKEKAVLKEEKNKLIR